MNALSLLWLGLSFPARLFLFFLLLTAAWTALLLVRTLILAHQKETAKFADRRASLGRRIETARQLHSLVLLVFGIAASNELLAVIRSIRYSSLSLGGAMIEIFEPLATLGLVVFGTLTLLHACQWIATARITAAKAAIHQTLVTRP